VQKKCGLAIILVVAGFLRLYNIGYSDYQGDETKALYLPKEVTSLRFFLEQRKGPVQFVVTAAVRNISNDYRNRVLVRLPFALAGLGSVLIFYCLIKLLFNERVALYSTVFFATNGFLVAFSRIVQYQSLVIFFGLLAVYLTKKYIDSAKLRYLVIAAVALAVSILSHYDGVFFMPIVFGILYGAVRNNLKNIYKHLVIVSAVFLMITGSFYIPFALNIAQSTTSYWAGRISGDVSGKISSSRYLFSVYQPIYVFHIYTLLGFMGFALATALVLRTFFPDRLGRLLSHHPSINSSVLLAMFVWFIIPLILLEAVISIPGTHIYDYLIPLCVVMGFALFHVELISRKFMKRFAAIFLFGTWTLFGFLAAQSYWIFVNHDYEYPWENKEFVFWTLPKPISTYHLSLFGFPYYRHWTEISDLVASDSKTEYYSTNERTSIPSYYVNLKKDSKKLGYYVYILHPQSLVDGLDNKKVLQYAKDNPPYRSFSNGNRVVAEVYLLPL
jgi:4-amino-4-deoxy-L-arabinose transferase-like glycosyltransferase